MLNEFQFTTLDEAREVIDAWSQDYNANRPHSSIGNRTPEEFVRERLNEQLSPVSVA